MLRFANEHLIKVVFTAEDKVSIFIFLRVLYRSTACRGVPRYFVTLSLDVCACRSKCAKGTSPGSLAVIPPVSLCLLV